MTPDNNRPLLVFGGPYSNLQATTAILAEAKARAIPMSNVICTGDVVAYAGDPEATSQLIRHSGMAVIAGNCEEQLADAAADCGCGFEEGSACDVLSKSWFAYADRTISRETRTWMANLETRLDFTYAGRTVCVVHATRDQNNRFVFQSQVDAVRGAYGACSADIVLAGHSGLPFISAVGAGAWVNAGVVGVPANDATPDGWFAILENSANGDLHIKLHRLSYDARAAADAIRLHGHAMPYADAIETGHWPNLDILPDAERARAGVRLEETSLVLARSAQTELQTTTYDPTNSATASHKVTAV